MSGSPLIKLDELTKPATVLIEKISDAVGGVFKPYQIVRVAKAEAEADQIRAYSAIEITDLQRRAMHRFLVEEGKKQSNIEEIAGRALPLLNEDSKPQDVNDDWIANFFGNCRIVSDVEMQQLWARVLAAEANGPGTFSRRTVNLLSDLERRDAELFEILCSFGWVYGEGVPLLFPFVLDVRDKIYSETGLFYSNLSNLESLGLLQLNLLSGFSMRNQPKHVSLSYFGSSVQLTLPNVENNVFQLGQVLLTQAGQELARVCTPQPIEGLFEYVLKRWEEGRLTPEVRRAPPAP
jgi:hypothetical protein